MIAAALIAASVLAPAGTATIQGYPVCLPVTAQPGSTYDLHVSASPGTLSVGPAHDAMERRLHQVPPSWVTFGSSGSVQLNVSRDAAPGAYWSDITVTSAPGGSGQVGLGTAATAAFVFTVGPSATPPPPCGALTEAYYSGRFPAWPTAAYATTGWKQVFAEEQRDNPKPVTSPTAGTGASAPPAAAPAYSPAAASSGVGPNRDAWVVLAGLAAVIIVAAARRGRS
jgi:hypothetical protein